MARQWWEPVTKLSLWAEFSPFPWQNSEYLIKIKSDAVKNHEQKTWRKSNPTIKTYLPLPIDVGKAAIGAGGQTQCVGWVFTIPIMAQKVCYWKIIRCSKETWVKNVKEFKSNLQNKTPRCPLMLARWWCGAGSQTQCVGWVFAIPMLGP
jgi:hypothetical protein